MKMCSNFIIYNKKDSIEQIELAVKIANAEHIITQGELIIGAPMETEEHFYNNIVLLSIRLIHFK